MGTPALIALGSNLGDRAATLDRAIADLADALGVSVRAVSTYHETAPVGGPGGQGAFLNAAAALETTLEPFALHRLLLEVERRAGRVREVRWDARTLDLDLILFGDRIIDTPGLKVPHQRFAVRRFVLAPLAEVAPDATDPFTGRSVLDLLVRLDRRPGYVAVEAPIDASRAARVAGRVAASLGSEARSRSPAPESTTIRAAPFDRFDRLEADARILDTARDEEASRPGDGWLVTDFCLGFDLLRLLPDTARDLVRPAGGPVIEAIERRHDALSKAQSSVLSPTFCVLLDFERWARLEIMGRVVDFPLLIPEATDEDGIVAEVIAACRATRS